MKTDKQQWKMEAQEIVMRKLQDAIFRVDTGSYSIKQADSMKDYLKREMNHLEKRYGFVAGSWQREI